MPKIFLSYAREDQSFADSLRNVLLSWDQQPWMDVHEIRPGARWWEEIDAGLRSSEVVVGLLSPRAIISDNVRNEWNWALEAGRKLVLMLLGEVGANVLSHRFVGLQWIDFHSDSSAGFDRLRRVLDGAEALDTPLAGPRRLRPRAPDNRRRMLDRVEAYWVEGVLHQAVQEANRFTIGYDLAPEALVRHVDYSDCALPASSDFATVFRHVGAELLILGAPGSGKTILLLQLAEQLLAAARTDDSRPIPIVLNLSSWGGRRETLAEWIAHEASLSYQIPIRAVRRWVEDERVLPLLDGLDEVPAEFRDGCVEAINQFRQTHRGVGVVVCSRIADYDALKSRLDLRAAILLEGLDDRQTSAVLDRPALTGLRATIAREPWLAEMTRTPFLLNVMAYAYDGRGEPELRLPIASTGVEPRLAHLFDTYIARRFAEGREKRTLTVQALRSRLAWLADRMQTHGHSVFHLESLQPEWLSSVLARSWYCIASMALLGVAIGVMVTTVVGALALVPWWMGVPIDLQKVLGFGITLLCGITACLLYAGASAAALEFQRSPQPTGRRARETTLFALLLVALLCGLAALEKPDRLPELVADHTLLVRHLVTWVVLGSITAGWWLALGRGFRSRKPTGYFLLAGVPMLVITETPKMMTDTPQGTPWWMWAGAFGILMLVGAVVNWILSLVGHRVVTTEGIQWRWRAKPVVWTTLIFFPYAAVIQLGENRDGPQGVWPALLSAALRALLLGLIFGTLFGFHRSQEIRPRIRPNQGVIRSLRKAASWTVWFALAGLVCRALWAVVFDRGTADAVWITEQIILFVVVFATLGALIGGCDVFIKHWILRALLTRTERVPLRLGRFLDLAAGQLLLRRVGGGYIFVHRYLLEHFARIHRATRRA